MMKRTILFALELMLAAAAASAQTLPLGVTTQPIDGGNNYYCSHNLSLACNAGWDHRAFFPVGVYYGSFQTQADKDRWLDLGLNFSHRITGNSNVGLLGGGVYGVSKSEDGVPENTLTGNIVGLDTFDEPSTATQWEKGPRQTPNSAQDGRFWMLNGTWNQVVYQDIDGVPMAQVLAKELPTPNGTTRHIDIASVDQYWFASAAGAGGYQCGRFLNLPGDCSVDQVKRGSNYGAVVEQMRVFAGKAKPILGFVEDGGPFSEDTTAASYITPAELNWAVWQSIIHGARMISYFNHSFAGPAISDDNLAQNYYKTSGIYAQVKSTNSLIKSYATILNAPTANNYASVSPQADQANPRQQGGIDVMAKLHPQNGYYLFAATRESEGAHNISATFTLNDPLARSVKVIGGENRTIPVVNQKFSDTFASGATVHIYRVLAAPAP